MWLFAMFDLPMTSQSQKKQYAQFRRLLLDEGFSRVQYSVYARYCRSEQRSKSVKAHIRQGLPDDGQVRLMLVTDRQFAKMEVFFGKGRRATEDPPTQYMLF